MIIADGIAYRAELVIGTREGYTGPEVVTPGDLIPLIEAFQKDYRGRHNMWHAAIVWTRGTVMGPTFPHETVIKVTVENNPLYTPDHDITAYVTELAEHLAKALKQVRVSVVMFPVRSIIVEVE